MNCKVWIMAKMTRQPFSEVRTRAEQLPQNETAERGSIELYKIKLDH